MPQNKARKAERKTHSAYRIRIFFRCLLFFRFMGGEDGSLCVSLSSPSCSAARPPVAAGNDVKGRGKKGVSQPPP